MSLAAARPMPATGPQELDRSIGEAAPDPRVALRFAPSQRRRPVRDRFGWLLDYLWLGSLTATGLLALLGFTLALAGPYERAHPGNPRNSTIIDCRSGGDCKSYLRGGWSAPGKSGIETISSVATLLFPPVSANKGWVGVRLYGEPFFASQDQSFWVDILVEGRRTLHRLVQRGEAVPVFQTAFPTDPAARPTPLHVTLVIGAAHADAKIARGRPISGWRVEGVSIF